MSPHDSYESPSISYPKRNSIHNQNTNPIPKPNRNQNPNPIPNPKPSMNHTPIPDPNPSCNTAISSVTPTGLMSPKVPPGIVDQHVLDVDLRWRGEAQQPLRFHRIKSYTSFPDPIFGREIAVNKSFISYGLKSGDINVLTRSDCKYFCSLQSHSKHRITDMAFFAEHIDLLASARTDGTISASEFVQKSMTVPWGHKIVIEIRMTGDSESFHPCICWHSQRQEILYVGIGNQVLKVDTRIVANGMDFSQPLCCRLDKGLCDGVSLVGQHEGDVTGLAISQWWATICLVSSSEDGAIKIWDERYLREINKGTRRPLATWSPHGGQAVRAVSFLNSLSAANHVNLLTAGPSEIKLWSSRSKQGWLLPGDSEYWRCTQTLCLTPFSNHNLEDTFLNNLVVLPEASMIIVSNPKKNTISLIHLDYGNCPVATRMIYSANFGVAMPILSLSGNGKQEDFFCLDKNAIRRYDLPVWVSGTEGTEAETTSGIEVWSAKDEIPSAPRPSVEETNVNSVDIASQKELERVSKKETERATKAETTSCIERGSTKDEIPSAPLPSVEETKVNNAEVASLTQSEEESERVSEKETERVNQPKVTPPVEETITGRKEHEEAERLSQPKVTPSKELLTRLITQGEFYEAINIALQSQDVSLVCWLCEHAYFPVGPTKELLTRLITDWKYEEAFTIALRSKDVSIVSWLCSQVNFCDICSLEGMLLSQEVLLNLMMQLVSDFASDTARKVLWIRSVALAIDPQDPKISKYVPLVYAVLQTKLLDYRSCIKRAIRLF